MDVHKELYNFCLDERIKSYKEIQKSPSCFDQITTNIPKFKNLTNTTSMRETIRRLENAFQSFFRRIKQGIKPGFPRFKKLLNSIDFVSGDGAKIKGKRLYVQHVGDIKIILHQELPKHSHIIVKHQKGQWFASFTIDAPIKTLFPSLKTIGLDFGLKTFITTSDGDKINSPKYLKRSLQRIKKASSRRDKCEKGSSERKAKSKIVSNIFRKITNQRADFNHKLSQDIVSQYGTIIIEDLDIKKLSSGDIKNINRTYADVSWAQFAQMLTYKAEHAGRNFICVNPANTSKACHKCGKLHDLTLDDRVIACECGYANDRDVNAAKNILRLGLQSLELKNS